MKTHNEAEQKARKAAAFQGGTQIINSGLTEWVYGLQNKVRDTDKIKQQQKLIRHALMDNKGRAVAYVIPCGFAVPDPKILDGSGIRYILNELTGEIEIKGTQAFCERVEAIAKLDGIAVLHDYQETAAERNAATARYEQQQKDDAKNGGFSAPEMQM